MWFYAEKWYQKLHFRNRPLFSRLNAPQSGGLRFQLKKNNFQCPTGCTIVQAGGLRKRQAHINVQPVGPPQYTDHWSALFSRPPDCPFAQSIGSPKIHVFPLETWPSSPPGMAFQPAKVPDGLNSNFQEIRTSTRGKFMQILVAKKLELWCFTKQLLNPVE